MPEVSIIMPVYNRSRYLEDSIKSIFRQSRLDSELIIIDDGSTDDIRGEIEVLRKNAPVPMRYFRQENQGPGLARNNGIREAQGKYIAFLDADDEWLPEFLERTTQALESQGCDWVMTPSVRIVLDENEREISREVIHGEPLERYPDIFTALLRDNIVGGPSQVVVKKDCMQKLGSFRRGLRVRDDWDMWIRLARGGCKLFKVDEPLYVYKIRRNSITKSFSHVGLQNTYQILVEYSKEAFLRQPELRQHYAERMWNLARHILYGKKRDYPLFFKCLIKSQLFSPSLGRILQSFRSMARTNDKKLISTG